MNDYENANTLKILKSQLKNCKFDTFTSVTCAFELYFLFQFYEDILIQINIVLKK